VFVPVDLDVLKVPDHRTTRSSRQVKQIEPDAPGGM
jgi:hypothetical protein